MSFPKKNLPVAFFTLLLATFFLPTDTSGFDGAKIHILTENTKILPNGYFIEGWLVAYSDTIPKKKEWEDENEEFGVPFEQRSKIPKKKVKLNEVPESFEKKYEPEKEVKVVNLSAEILQIPDEYSGYSVEIKRTATPLEITDPIFTQHGNIILHQVSDTKFSYMLGDFSKEEAATDFLENILLSRYPDAKVITYKNGIRLE